MNKFFKRQCIHDKSHCPSGIKYWLGSFLSLPQTEGVSINEGWFPYLSPPAVAPSAPQQATPRSWSPPMCSRPECLLHEGEWAKITYPCPFVESYSQIIPVIVVQLLTTVQYHGMGTVTYEQILNIVYQLPCLPCWSSTACQLKILTALHLICPILSAWNLSNTSQQEI